MGKQQVLGFVADAADDAGAAVRSLLADDSMFAAFRRPEVLKHLPADLHVRLMRNDPSVIPDIMALGKQKANIDDLAQRAMPAVEIPYRNEGVGRREAVLDPSVQQSFERGIALPGNRATTRGAPVGMFGGPDRQLATVDMPVEPRSVEDIYDTTPQASFERGLVPYGNRGRGIPVGLDEGPGTGLSVVDAGPSRRTPGAGRRESPLDPSAGWTGSGGTDLIPFQGGRGPGVPVGGVGNQSMTVYQAPAAPRRDFSGLLAALSAAGAIGSTAYHLNRATSGTARPEVLVAPQRASQPSPQSASRPIDVLLGMGIHPERAETLVAAPQYMTDSEARRFRSLPPEQRALFLNR